MGLLWEHSKRWNTISKITSHCSVTQFFSIICGLLFRCLLHYFCGRINSAKKKSILFSFPSPNPFVPFRDKSSVKYFITRIRDVSCDHTLHHQVDSAELFKTTQVRICSDTITISIAMLEVGSELGESVFWTPHVLLHNLLHPLWSEWSCSNQSSHFWKSMLCCWCCCCCWGWTMLWSYELKLMCQYRAQSGERKLWAADEIFYIGPPVCPHPALLDLVCIEPA